MVCDNCKKLKYCNYTCRARKEEKEKFILEIISKTKVGKMMAIINKYTDNY